MGISASSCGRAHKNLFAASDRATTDLKKAEGELEKVDEKVAAAREKADSEKQEVERRLQAAHKETEEHLREAKQAEAELASYKACSYNL